MKLIVLLFATVSAFVPVRNFSFHQLLATTNAGKLRILGEVFRLRTKGSGPFPIFPRAYANTRSPRPRPSLFAIEIAPFLENPNPQRKSNDNNHLRTHLCTPHLR